MPTSKDEAPAKPASKAEKKVDRAALADELEVLKAAGNPNPARLAEIKKELAS